MSKKNILFVISNLNIGGPQKSLLALTDILDYNKFNVDILSIKPNGTLKDYFNKNINFLEPQMLLESITIPTDSIGKTIIYLIKKAKLLIFTDIVFSIIKHIFIKKNMNQERQKIWKKYKNNLPKLSKKYDAAFGILGMSTYVVSDIVSADNKYHWIRSDARILNRNQDIDEEYFKKMTGFLAVSYETAKIFEELYPFSKHNMNVMYNYIPINYYNKMSYDDELLKSSNEYTKLLTISRLDPLKGLDFAIEACKILIDKGYKIKWYILGDGKYRYEIENLIDKNNLTDFFILLGFQKNTLAFINDADIVVHPSRTEGKSNAVDEAKYVGKPIVATRYDTVAEQIKENQTGLISELNGVSLADKIELLLNDSILQNKLIENCLNEQQHEEDPNEFFLNLIKNEGK